MSSKQKGITSIKKFRKTLALVAVIVIGAGLAGAQSNVVATTGGDFFYPLAQWKDAVIAGDAAVLKNFYSTDPAAEIDTNSGHAGAADDIAFWLGLKAKSIKLEIVRLRVRPTGT